MILMTIRELTTTEITLVSGASDLQNIFNGVKALAECYREADPQYKGKDWRFIAASEPGIYGSLMDQITELGGNAKEGMLLWKRKYA